jgi:hypothetical protein
VIELNNLYTDIDDVCLKWMEGFRSFLISKDISINGSFPIQWDMSHWVNGPWKDLIREFNSSPAFGKLKPFKDAVDVLGQLKQNNFHITAITACSADPQVHERRWKNLEKHFDLIFDKLITVDLGQSKFEILKGLEPGYWVEDRMENALDGLICGHTCFLMTRPHNMYQQHSEIVRVKSWNGILTRINLRLEDEKQLELGVADGVLR